MMIVAIIIVIIFRTEYINVIIPYRSFGFIENEVCASTSNVPIIVLTIRFPDRFTSSLSINNYGIIMGRDDRRNL